MMEPSPKPVSPSSLPAAREKQDESFPFLLLWSTEKGKMPPLCFTVADDAARVAETARKFSLLILILSYFGNIAAATSFEFYYMDSQLCLLLILLQFESLSC
ncbi:uncharacterized protein DS421_9g266610 [Arachis hypogaea]|nr:uncharacterized protein DS421_9g266610 [Arachis hypogaea]